MSKQVLILTDKSDLHPTSVINLLNKENVPFFRLNTEDLMVDYDFSWFHYNDSIPDFYIKDRNNEKVIWGHDILSVWYRRPEYPKNLLYTTSEEIDKHNLRESKQFYIFLMYYLSDIYSIGNHFYDKRANSKMIQSKLAVELGMKIAPTCFSNKKQDIIRFSEEYNYISLKCLRTHWILTEDDRVYEMCTQKVDSKSLVSQPEESFNQTVVFAQKYVEKKHELRITVMGPYIFTCKLDSQAQTPSTGAVDWRQGYDYGIKHEIIDTPLEIENFCRKYLRRLNLNFGCFDFIVTPNDEFVFLECNPNGQWGWIEDECNVPMSEALVDCLCNRLIV